MFKVGYDTVAIMPDGSTGNLSQGKGIAYMQCELKEIDNTLKDYLGDRENPLHPIVGNIERVEGEIVL